MTQVLDRPLTGRVFFEEVIRQKPEFGRPSQVQLIFDRRVSRRTPGRIRTRVITDAVVPSLHVDYKNSRIKQYHKEGRALRRIGLQAKQRLLDVQTIPTIVRLAKTRLKTTEVAGQ